jgi:glycosyltransferase involved in cell wall biosynthesis
MTDGMNKKMGLQNDVTIGIPVYNEAALIERAIRSAAPQCQRLIIADNASTDNTQNICQELMSEYANLEYFRHETNTGALNNWFFLLSQVDTEYYMTIGSHDYIKEESISSLTEILKSEPDVVLAAAALFFEYEGACEIVPHDLFNSWRGGLENHPASRLRNLLYSNVGIPWAVYGLFRTSIYRANFTFDLPVVGADQIFLYRTALAGKIKIDSRAGYVAWQRKSDTRADYIKRIRGDSVKKNQNRELRYKFRLAVYDLLVSLPRKDLHSYNWVIRLHVMSRFGVFKKGRADVLFYLLYVPARIISEIRRFKKRFVT